MNENKYFEISDDFRQEITKFRKANGLTLRELGDEIDYSPTMLCRLEKGDRNRLPQEVLEKLETMMEMKSGAVPVEVLSFDATTELKRLKEENEALKHLLRLTWGWE